MFAIEMLPAGHGDSLWIEYGEPERPYRVLIDGGTGPTYDVLRARIGALPPDLRRFELMAVTHIDADHIEGMVKLAQDERLGVEFADAWFNGWRHLPVVDFGPEQGEIFSALLVDRGVPWNLAFGGGPVWVPDGEGHLPVVELEGGLKLTVLGPTLAELAALQRVWERELRREGLTPGSTREALDLLYKSKRLLIAPVEFGVVRPELDVEALAAPDADPDTSEPNASSITLLAEYEGRRALLAGDAVAPVLTTGIKRLLAERDLERLELDAFKVSHHGSRRNVRDAFLPLIQAKRHLFSSNGSYFHHPDPEAVARVLVGDGGPRELFFNYRTEENEIWDDPRLMERWNYRATYPEPGQVGMRVEL